MQIASSPLARSTPILLVAFLVPSISGNQYLLVLYDYDSNFIHAKPMKNRTKEMILAAYHHALILFKSWGLLLKLATLDNEASAILQQYLHDENLDF
jgi:hypothetical protein